MKLSKEQIDRHYFQQHGSTNAVSIFCFGYLPFQFYSFYKDGKQEKEMEWL